MTANSMGPGSRTAMPNQAANAAERVTAAVDAARALPFPFMLTARGVAACRRAASGRSATCL